MPFDPREHLTKLQGKDYLEVRWRLAWLREAHPTAVITTELVAYDVAQEWAIVRATVTLPDGGGSATGMVFQRPTGIAKDWVANGETSAIGRALGALGFGTQFAQEFDQGDQVVDSPVVRQTTSASAGAPIAPLPAANLAPVPVLAGATADQRAGYLRSMHALGMDADAAMAIVRDTSGVTFEEATRGQMGTVYRAAQTGRLAQVDGRWHIVEPPAESVAEAAPLVAQLAAAVK